MTTFGPETPLPFCVASEQHLRKSIEVIFKDNENRNRHKYLTGEWNELDFNDSIEYENKFCDSINKYLDIDCTDHILYIRAKGDEDSSLNTEGDHLGYKSNSMIKNWPKIIEKKFCIFKSVDCCEISLSDIPKEYDESIGLEKEPSFDCNFVECKNKSKKYDKIIVKNCLKFFDENQKYFCKFIMNLFKEQLQTRPSLLIIQRVCDLNTLPFHDKISEDWSLNDVKYTKFMETMQNEYFSIKFDIELFKYLIDCKSTWYTQLKNNEHYPLNQNTLLLKKQTLSDRNELVHGIRGLNEGVFKYQTLDRYIELSDRMLFIGAYHELSRETSMASRIKEKKEKNLYNSKQDLSLDNEITNLFMEITPDLKPLLNSISFKHKK